MPDRVEYRSPDTEPPHPRRSAGTWVILFTVWIVGIVIWGLYLALGAVLLIRFL
jgi:hypothetical protein